ncbi:MAG TPA: YdeI/OmpD-associated family protein [Actinomycetota bacterium]
MDAIYFSGADEFRAWMEENHHTAAELYVGFHKKGAGIPSMTWEESVDVALCFGWIDGVRRSVDDERYVIRFTPRRPGSVWSARNIERAKALIEEGRMIPAGLAAFEARREDRSPYSYERRASIRLDEDLERRFRRASKAWERFQAMAPSYRKSALHWVMSAKRHETRERRLERLIADSAAGRRVPPLAPRERRG